MAVAELDADRSVHFGSAQNRNGSTRTWALQGRASPLSLIPIGIPTGRGNGEQRLRILSHRRFAFGGVKPRAPETIVLHIRQYHLIC